MDKLNDVMGKGDKKCRQRGENWCREEKNLFLEIMRESALIVESKQTDTNTNKQKKIEWLKVQNRLKELTGVCRDVTQIKGFWRRIKMTAKKNVSQYKSAVRATGGGIHPPSPSEDDYRIIKLCPTDLVIESNELDRDGVFENVNIDSVQSTRSEMPNSTIYDVELTKDFPNKGDVTFANEIITVPDVNNKEVYVTRNDNKKISNNKSDKLNQSKNESSQDSNLLKVTFMEEIIPDLYVPIKNKQYEEDKSVNKHFQKCKTLTSHKGILVSSNIDFKKRTKDMMEEEHVLKIKYQKLELAHQKLRQKLEIDILLLEKEKKLLEIKILKNKLE